MTTRSPYSGYNARLAIAIDVGTTFSGASYTILRPGQVPEIYDVNGFKGQEKNQNNSKVPSVLLYTPSGDLLACGSETKQSKFRSMRGIRTEWFKLALRPDSMRIDAPKVEMPPNRDLVDVFGDFLKYMYNCIRTHIQDTQIDGSELWSSLSGTAHFVLSHPNGWGSYQQGRMREAAIRGGLVPNTPEGRERIEFVTEGEASFHWCIDQGLMSARLKEGATIVVADLGGGTIDVSSFTVKTPKPLRLQEQIVPDCSVEGSIIVTRRFMKSAEDKLRGTPFGHDDYIDTLRDEFDGDTKCLFRATEDNGDDVCPTRIGGRRDNYEDENGVCKIEMGYLEIQRDDIEAAFEPSVAATVNGIRKHVAGRRDVYVFLVGGFAASPYVFVETKSRLQAAGIPCEVKRAEGGTAKAAAHGGVGFYLDRNVTERTMRHSYGVFLRIYYDSSNLEHRAREHKLWIDPTSGAAYVQDGFIPLVKKGQVVKVDSVYRQTAESAACRMPQTTSLVQKIMRYNGTQQNISFIDMDPNSFDDIGQLSFEVPASALTVREGTSSSGGRTYYVASFTAVIILGAVEIKAYAEWEENGVKKTSPAKSIWEDYY